MTLSNSLIDRPRVLRTFSPPLTQFGLSRFSEIAEAAKTLNHPHLVPLYDFGISAEGTAYLVRERQEGVKFTKLMRTSRKMEEALVIAIFTQVCEALEHAVGEGVSCGDLSPDNIYIVDAGSTSPFVRIVGIGTQRNAFEQDCSALSLIVEEGATRYASPERCLGKPVDERSLVYNIGCMMYEAVHGNPAFHASDVIKTLFEHVNGATPHFPERIDRLDYIIRKCIEKTPEQRYKDIRNLRLQLEQETVLEDQMARKIIARIEKEPHGELKTIFRCSVMMIVAYLCLFGMQQSQKQLSQLQTSNAKAALLQPKLRSIIESRAVLPSELK